MKSENLLDDLVQRTKDNINSAVSLLELESSLLNKRHSSDSWSALECLQHLNLYSDFYNPVFRLRLNNSGAAAAEDFHPGWLGNYFAKMMLPDSGKKMKTFKDKDPLGSQLNASVIEHFITDQKELLNLLELSRSKNLNQIRIPITISRFITLKLGDALRFVIYHNQRHIGQALRAVAPEMV